MEVVLGLSMSSHVTRLALVEGADGRGVTLEQDEFPVNQTGGVGSPGISEHVVAVILGTLALAAAQNYRLATVGITWTDDLDTEGWLVTDSLRSLGIRNVVSVPMIDAVEAFVQTLADAAEDRAAAALILEADCATATTVSAERDGTSRVVSQVYHGRFSCDASIRSLGTSMLANLDSDAKTVAVVASGADEDWIVEQLSDLTPFSVTVPAECEVALARGAAIAAARARAMNRPAHDGIDRLKVKCSTVARAHHARSKPLLFVPRTARLAALTDDSEPEAPTSVPSDASSTHRGSATTHLLMAMLIMVSFTLLVSLVILTNESGGAHSPQSSGAAEAPVALPSPSAPAFGDPNASPNSTPPPEMFAIPGLKSFSPNTTASAQPLPPPPAVSHASTAPVASVPIPRAVPEALSPFVPFFNGMLAVLQGGLPPSSPPPAGGDPLVIEVPEPMRAAMPDATQVPIPNLDLSLLANLSGPR